MKHTARSLIILVLMFTLCIFSLPRSEEASTSHQHEAQVLSNLGLLKGSSNGFELDRKPTRAEGAVMLVRLLGRENQVRSQNYQHPYTDVPAWASPYIGYMYRFSLTQGSTAHTFSPNDELSPPAYTTFVLRALGYNDQAGDFNWRDSLEKAVELGMLTRQQASDLANHHFTRNDMVNISYLALKIPLKNRSITLIEKLVNEDGAVSTSAARSSGLMPGTSSTPVSQVSFATTSPISQNKYTIKNSGDMQRAFEQALLNLQSDITLSFYNYSGDPLADFDAVLEQAQTSIENDTGLANLLSEWGYKGDKRILNVNFSYRYTWTQLMQLNKKGDEIVTSVLSSGLSDYDKEKALHDYVINHCRYDDQSYQNSNIPQSSYTAYGVLILGRGVCQGYAEAMNIVCRKAGLPSLMIKGTSKGENHAWNLIKIEGQYYHLDSTWDDPVNQNGQDSLSYIYFNLSDKEMQKDHQWQAADYPVCNSMQYNYHVYNHQYVDNYAVFAEYVTAAVDRGEANLELRIQNFDPADYKDLGRVVGETSKVSRYQYSINEEQGVVGIFNLQYR